MILQSLFHYLRKQRCTEPSNKVEYLQWLELSVCSPDWSCLIVLEKDNEAFKSDGGAGGRAALPEDEKAESAQ